MDYKDYYKILGLDKSASADAIKKAYRKLAVKYHPDKNPGDKAAEDKFKAINEAYEVLGNEENRKKYDALGENWRHYQQAGGQSGDFDWSQWGQGGRNQQYRYEGNVNDLFGSEGGFSDFFQQVFGGGGSRFQRRQKRATQGSNLEATLPVTLEEVMHGGEREIAVQDQTLKVKLKPGMYNGQVLRLKGRGTPGSGGGPAGDILLTIEIMPHARLTYKGKDLYTNADVDIYTAVLGGKVPVLTLDGAIQLTIPPNTDAGKVLRLKGKGLPEFGRPDERGDLFVTTVLHLPKNMSDKEITLFKQLAEIKNNRHAKSV